MDAKELARLIDGEGTICSCIKSSTRLPFPRVALAMADLVYPQTLHDIYGGSLSFYKQRNPNARGLWHWGVDRSRIKPLLLFIVPELRIKQVQAEAALLMLTTFPSQGKQPTDKQLVLRWVLHDLLRRLNKRGSSHRPPQEEVDEVLARLKEIHNA